MRQWIASFVLAGLLGVAGRSDAALITHVPGDRTPPVVVSSPFATVASGGVVGANFIDFGVDYSFGNVEAIFSDPPLAFSGVNSSNNVDLLTAVDGRIVLLGTTTQGLTNFISVVAGNSDANALLLEAFDLSGNLVGSATNAVGGATTFSVSTVGYSIASFRVSTPTSDTFGVRSVTLETPIAVVSSAVPEPSTVASLGLAGLIGLFARRRRRLLTLG